MKYHSMIADNVMLKASFRVEAAKVQRAWFRQDCPRQPFGDLSPPVQDLYSASHRSFKSGFIPSITSDVQEIRARIERTWAEVRDCQ